MEARVILSRCLNDKKLFGVRVEKRKNDWVRTWAFKISEQIAKNEKYGSEKINGSFNEADDFAGCPYCGARSFVLCTCGKMSCWNGQNQITCPWCGKSSSVQTASNFNFNSGGY